MMTPHRLVTPDAKSWMYTGDGYRTDWGPEPARTLEELTAAGAVPVTEAPEADVERFQNIIDALEDSGGAEDTVLAALAAALEVLDTEYTALGGALRMWAGRPGCWEVTRLQDAAALGDPDAPWVDQLACQTLRMILVSWVTGDSVVTPDRDIYPLLSQYT